MVGRPNRPPHTRADLPLDPPLPAVLRVVAVPDSTVAVADRDPHLTEVYELRRHRAGGWAYVFQRLETRGVAA